MKKNKLGLQKHAVSDLQVDLKDEKTLKKKKQALSRGKEKRKQTLSRGKEKRKQPLTKFEEYLALEKQKTTLVSAEEDLELERRLAKKLKVKHDLLHDASDGLSDLLEGLVPASKIKEEKTLHGKIGVLQSLSRQDEADQLNKDESSSESASDGVSDHSKPDFGDEDSELGDSHDDSIDKEDAQRVLHSLDDESRVDNATENAIEANEGYHAKQAAQLNAVEESNTLLLTTYIAPHRRAQIASPNELTQQLQRRTRGLLNRLSEDNTESIADEIFSLFQAHGRKVMTEIVTTEILGAVCSGPRGNQQYAAVFAAFVAGTASSIGMDFGAKFLASFAESLEEQRKREDSLAVRNMLLLFSYLYIFKLILCDVVYDLLSSLSRNLMELDVAMILTVLQTCGMGLRADDPAAMKDFILSVQNRCEDLKVAASHSETTFCSGKRMQFMLETILEIKNNKKRMKQEGIPHARLKKWLQKLGVEDVQLRALKWRKLLDPHKKGQWWISGADIEGGGCSNTEVNEFIHKETTDAEKMLKLAAAQKMNTDIRRAIFCVVMSGEDYLDAFEKLLRIKLTGKQDREIMRVIVECCLQEMVFNKYYSLLISKFCHHDKNHKFTLQYCLWDHFKQLGSMETRRLANLAHLLADLIATFSISLSVLKIVEFADPKTMTAKAVLFYSITLKVLLTAYSDELVRNAFMRIASTQELEGLRLKLSVFLHQHVIKGLQAKCSQLADKEGVLLLRRVALAKRAMTASSTL